MDHIVELVFGCNGPYSLGLCYQFVFALEQVREVDDDSVFALEDGGELLAEFVDDFGVFLGDRVWEEQEAPAVAVVELDQR